MRPPDAAAPTSRSASSHAPPPACAARRRAERGRRDATWTTVTRSTASAARAWTALANPAPAKARAVTLRVYVGRSAPCATRSGAGQAGDDRGGRVHRLGTLHHEVGRIPPLAARHEVVADLVHGADPGMRVGVDRLGRHEIGRAHV